MTANFDTKQLLHYRNTAKSQLLQLAEINVTFFIYNVIQSLILSYIHKKSPVFLRGYERKYKLFFTAVP
jgi:hypothetical protein